MYIQQEFSLLFFLRTTKTSKKTGKAPLYYRLKIDGASLDRCVKGVDLLPEHWDRENKVVKTGEPKAKEFNKGLQGYKPIFSGILTGYSPNRA